MKLLTGLSEDQRCGMALSPSALSLSRVQVGSQGTTGAEEQHNHTSWARTHLGGGCYRYAWGLDPGATLCPLSPVPEFPGASSTNTGRPVTPLFICVPRAARVGEGFLGLHKDTAHGSDVSVSLATTSCLDQHTAPAVLGRRQSHLPQMTVSGQPGVGKHGLIGIAVWGLALGRTPAGRGGLGLSLLSVVKPHCSIFAE